MEYSHRFEVQADLETVRRFHQSSDSFKALTPPPIITQLHAAPEAPEDGDRMDFTLWLGPIPVRWLAEFSDVGPQGFTDTQLRGPFKRWVHRHRFEPTSDGSTEIHDHIEAEIGFSLTAPIAIGMWLGLPFLFAYRAWRTKKDINQAAATNPADERN